MVKKKEIIRSIPYFEEDVKISEEKNEYKGCLSFLPVMQEGHSRNTNPDDFSMHLPKGKYDIDYVIALCKIIENKCFKLRFDPRSLEFTLRSSLKKIVGMLETEKCVGTSKRPVILFHCPNCNKDELIFADLGKDWVCNFCNPKLLQ